MRLCLPLVLAVLAAPAASAQPAQTLARFTTPGGVVYRAEVRPVAGRRELSVVVERGDVLRSVGERITLGTTFAAGTRLSNVRYRTNADGHEWLDFDAQDARYATRYRWHVQQCDLTWTARDRRTGRTTRGSRLCEG